MVLGQIEKSELLTDEQEIYNHNNLYEKKMNKINLNRILITSLV
jgi:hypothetical protein